jgi:hypothetical protein
MYDQVYAFKEICRRIFLLGDLIFKISLRNVLIKKKELCTFSMNLRYVRHIQAFNFF